MARPRNFLDRFRPAGTPGAAAKPGVPADRAAELSAELDPVLALLADTVAEARRIRDEGIAEAERIRHEGIERANAVRVVALHEAEAERADAAAHVTAQAEREAAALLAEARKQASEVRRRGREHMAEHVDDVLTSVKASVLTFRPPTSVGTGP